MIALPNFLIVGASKSGTSSIYHYLKQHPDIFLSNKQKEGRYFSKMEGNFQGPGDSKIDATITRNLEQYQHLFNGYNGEKAVGDISPEYLYFYENAVSQIKKDIGDETKIIIILRSPVERAFSGYAHFKRDNREHLSFEEGLSLEKIRMEKNWIWAWQYKNSGLYFEQVKFYLDNFKNVKIIVFEEFKNDAHKVLREICAFLEIDAEFNFDTSYKYNVSGDPKNKLLYQIETSRGFITFIKKFVPSKFVQKVKKKWTGEKQMIKPEINSNTKSELIEFFNADILKLQSLIKKDLSHWLK